MILDVEPFSKISHYDNKCFMYKSIRDFDINGPSFKLFRDLSFSNKRRKTIVAELR